MIYARVSSEEPERTAIDPDVVEAADAAANGFAVALEYIDVETAKQTGRVAFGEMANDGLSIAGAPLRNAEKA